MHPLFAGRLRRALYLAVWAGIGALLTAVLMVVQPRPLGAVVLYVAPLTVFYAFACLSAWYVCRANPLGSSSPERLLAAIAVASLLASVLWNVLAAVWGAVLARVAPLPGVSGTHARDLVTLGIAGGVLYAQSMAVHYALITLDAAREAEHRVLASQVAAREAELRALRAQLHPHFLFNSLNSISALAGSDPEGARRMCQRLGDFLRTSLSLGARERVALSEELTLAEHYLAIEQVRFGARLAFERCVSPAAAECLVPPLLIQPLIENAVKHGVADRIEGGTIRIEADVRGGRLEIAVANPRDPDAPPRRGSGLGLENVQQRLQALDPDATRLEVVREPAAFRVRLTLPELRHEGTAPR